MIISTSRRDRERLPVDTERVEARQQPLGSLTLTLEAKELDTDIFRYALKAKCPPQYTPL